MSIIENLRSNHEFAELFEQAVCRELDEKPSGQKQKVVTIYHCYVTLISIIIFIKINI
jgi:hypothetical protein